MTSLRNTVSGFASAAAMALGFATFVPANPALAATFANTDAATITMTGKIDLGDEQKVRRRAGLCAELPQARRQLARRLHLPGLPHREGPAHRLLRSSGRRQR